MGILAVPITVLILALGLNRGRVGKISLIADSFSSKVFPTMAVERMKRARLDGRVFDAWEWGGYIMYAWPSAQLHVDPLKFNDVTMKSYSTIEGVRPGWQAELALWNVRTVIVPTSSALAKELRKDLGWTTWYGDSLATVFRPSTAHDPAASPRI